MSRRLFASIALPPTLVLVAMALLSLRWRVTHDAPIMLYMAYLVDHGHAVPYRDFFDMNLPGSYWLYALLGRVSGYGDFGLRVADLVCLGGLSWTTFAWLRRIGWQPAWASAVLFGLVYLDGGPMLSFQREYLLLLPISAAALLAGTERWDARARSRSGSCSGSRPRSSCRPRSWVCRWSRCSRAWSTARSLASASPRVTGSPALSAPRSSEPLFPRCSRSSTSGTRARSPTSSTWRAPTGRSTRS